MRGKYQVVLLALFAMALLIVPTAARAGTNLGMQLSSSPQTVTICDNDINFTGCTESGGTDGDPTLGSMTYSGSVGDWSINHTSGVGPPVLSFPSLLDLTNFSLTTGGGVNPITVMLTVTNLSGPLGNLTLFNNISGTSSFAGTTITVQSWLSTSNTAFCASSTCGGGHGTLITNQSFTGINWGGAISGTGATGSGPYSITLAVTFDSHGQGDHSSFDDDLSIPEPATLSVLGAGLLALGTGLRKKLLRG
jgi:hypothetical protein